MISWESILSVFNTKGTLLKWLQKLEKALKDGVLLSVAVNTVSEGVITLTFNFADGSTITTPQIDIPQGAQGPQGKQGEQGPQGETGENYLFYSNITNLGKIPSAGDRFPLRESFLNRPASVGDRFIGVFKYNNQSFLATCRVDTGNEAVLSLVVETTGAAGSDIFNDFTSLKIDTTDATVTYIDGVAMITNARLIGYSSAGNEEVEIAVDIPITAGDNVTLDASDDNKSIQISATGGGDIGNAKRYCHNIRIDLTNNSVFFSVTDYNPNSYSSLSDVVPRANTMYIVGSITEKGKVPGISSFEYQLFELDNKSDGGGVYAFYMDSTGARKYVMGYSDDITSDSVYELGI